MKRWTRTTEKAAHMVAQDREPDREIAVACKVSERTLARWKTDKEFVARVEQIVSEYAERALRHGLARRDRRLGELTNMYQKLQQVAHERSIDPSIQQVPGGPTGFLVRRVASIGSGENFRAFSEYELDAALVRELRAILDQVSQECGQKIARTELTGADGKPLVPQVIYKLPFDPDTLSDEELDVMTRVYERAASRESVAKSGSPTHES
jgi:hypothetical protein